MNCFTKRALNHAESVLVRKEDCISYHHSDPPEIQHPILKCNVKSNVKCNLLHLGI
jgi:hypothetical protein